MSGPRGEKCKDCYFASDVGEIDDGWAVCKRNAPQALVTYSPIHDLLAAHPVVNTHFWCGEFKPHPDGLRTAE